MTFYPVIVPTLNRYEHFKRCVESLSQNTHADKTELVVGLDYPPSEKYVEGYEKIKAYLPTIMGFKKVTVFTSEKNLGPEGNARRLRKYVEQSGYDAYIATEDDNEFSPCFLDFMNKALERYKKDKRILCICGYTPVDYVGDENIYFARAMSAWGCGWIFEKRKEIIPYCTVESMKKILDDWRTSIQLFWMRSGSLNSLITQVKKNVAYGDSACVRYCLLNNVYCLFPATSLVRNWGNDGSGLHCKVDNERFIKRSICRDNTFILKNIPVMEKKEVYELLKKDYTKHWYGNVAILIRYIIWRLLHRDFFVLLEHWGFKYTPR